MHKKYKFSGNFHLALAFMVFSLSVFILSMFLSPAPIFSEEDGGEGDECCKDCGSLGNCLIANGLMSGYPECDCGRQHGVPSWWCSVGGEHNDCSQCDPGDPPE